MDRRAARGQCALVEAAPSRAQAWAARPVRYIVPCVAFAEGVVRGIACRTDLVLATNLILECG